MRGAATSSVSAALRLEIWYAPHVRRVLVGIAALIAGLVVYTYSTSRVLGIMTGAAVIALADWLGLMPGPFQQSARDLMHGDDQSGGP